MPNHPFYLDEIQYKPGTVRVLQDSFATVSQTLSHMDFTRKAISRSLASRDENECVT